MKKNFTIFCLFSLIGLSGFAQVNLDSGLVAKYYFNGNANDESGNGNNGTVNGATLTTNRFGNANSAYNFNDTSNYIDIIHNDIKHNRVRHSRESGPAKGGTGKHWIPPYQVRGRLGQARNDKEQKIYVVVYSHETAFYDSDR